MDPRQWAECKPLLAEAMDRPVDERRAFIVGRCADPVVCRELVSIAEHDAAITDLVNPHALAPGDHIGEYRIEGLIGAGGMGEVYRAADLRLRREVAIKVLPPAVAQDRSRLARFEREAQLLAALNNPHIAAVHGFFESGGVSCLVLELIEGESLASRLIRGPLERDEALRIADDVLDALAAAHRAGIVHRDLKPANIMLTRSGAKVLDLGLAKRTDEGLSALTHPPDLTSAGVIVGTAAYMSPEQIEGRDVDARTDLFAFGCVLYEALAGQRPFAGDSPASVMAAILQTAPEPLGNDVPPILRWAILRCLAKHRDERWQTAIDLRAELQRPGEQPELASPSTRPALVVAVLLVVAALGLTIVRWPRAATADAARHGVVRTYVLPPDGYSFVGAHPTFSPDGTHLAFLARPADELGVTSFTVWVQSVRDGVATEVSNSTGSLSPVFSPDGARVAFCVNYEDIHVVELQGNGRTVIAAGGCDAVAWRSDGRILFIRRGSVLSVGESGADAERLLERQPDAAADGLTMIPGQTPFLVRIYSKDASRTGYYYFDPASRSLRFLLKATYARYAAPGWLVFSQDPASRTSQALHMQRFDARAGLLNGEARTIVTAAGFFDVFGEELLAIPPWMISTDLSWHDRAGRVTGVVEPPSPGQRPHHPRVSPDGRLLAYETGRGLWVRNLATGATTHVTTGDDAYPIWSNDSRELVFTRDYASLWRASADASGRERKLLDGAQLFPRDWSPDGRSIIFGRGDGLLARLDLTTGRDTPFLQSPTYDTWDAQFSPNGHWIAYSSTEAGGNDVYVAEYPDTSKKWKVSPSGGTEPTWRGDGRELFYLNAKQTLVAVTVDPTGDELRFGPQRELFAVKISNPLELTYHVTPDGQRFVITLVRPDSHPPMQIISNWTGLFR